MPLPKPGDDESKTDFISRCISNDNVQSEFDNQDERAGYCYSAWNNKKNKTIQDLLNNAADEIENL